MTKIGTSWVASFESGNDAHARRTLRAGDDETHPEGGFIGQGCLDLSTNEQEEEELVRSIAHHRVPCFTIRKWFCFIYLARSRPQVEEREDTSQQREV